MKSYCTQNGGECGTCSLANYGRDCRNAPLGEEGGRMTHAEFTHEMLKAKTFAGLGERPDYWRGYQRGLRRAYHGIDFGTEQEHAQWLQLVDSDQEDRREMGLGYRDGLLK